MQRMRFPGILCALALLPGLLQPPAARGQLGSGTSAPPSLEAAKQEIRAGKLEEAIAHLKTLAAAEPASAEVFHQLGLALYKAGHLGDAEGAFGRAIALNPEDKEAVQLRGLALYRTGRPKDALPLLERVRQWVPAGSSDVDYILGLCYTDVGRYDDARQSFAQQYRVEPGSAAAYLIAGNLFLRAHLTPAAEAAGRAGAALDPHMPLMHYLLGEIALSREDVPHAIEEFQAEARINPGYGRVYDRLGDAFLRQGRYDDAQAALNRSIILDPAVTGPYIQLGKLMLRRADPVSAEMYLRRAEAMDPNNFMTHALLGQALRSLGRADEAARQTKAAESLQEATQPQLEQIH